MNTPQTIHQRLLELFAPVLTNIWANELPPRPTWPAACFELESQLEEAWCMGGGYTAHDVQLVVLSRTLAELDALLPMGGGGPFRAALEADPVYQFEQMCEDASYEGDAQVYARVLSFRMRTRRY